MKLLITAYACSPDRGSEPGVGWNIPRHLSEEHEVWILTRRKNLPAIERAIEADGLSNLHVIGHDLEWALPFKKAVPGSVYPYHYLWQLSVAPKVRSLHERERFDLVHSLTLGSVRFPSTLHRLGPPVVVGPLGGLEQTPIGLWSGFGVAGVVKETVRSISNRVARIDPFVRRTLRQASLVLAASHDGKTALDEHFAAGGPVRVLPAIGIKALDIAVASDTDMPTEPLRALFVGRLEHWKGAHLALRGLARARSEGTPVRLTILGSGPRSNALERLTQRLRLSAHVDFIERVPTLQDVADLYRDHHVLVFPSLHESGGMVAIEAMAHGLPVICIAIGGPADSVGHERGYAIRAARSSAAVREIARALSELNVERGRLEEMGNAAMSFVSNAYTWPIKARRLSDLYREIT